MRMSRVKKILAIIENLLFLLFCIIVILFLIQLFCFTSFKIPSDSMEPALKDGDRILVNKMIKGARLFNVFAALDNKDVTIFRIPGLGSFKRNDVLVFNFPYQMKRCIALPGDTLEIRGGFYKVCGCHEQLGNYKAQQYLAKLQQPEKQGIVVGTFPYDGSLGWNIREFGPLPIPQKEQIVVMNRTNYLLYRQLIAWEQKKKIHLKEEQVFIGDSLIHQYCLTLRILVIGDCCRKNIL